MAWYDKINITDQTEHGSTFVLAEGCRRKFPVGLDGADDENVPALADIHRSATVAGAPGRGGSSSAKPISGVLDMDFDL